MTTNPKRELIRLLPSVAAKLRTQPDAKAHNLSYLANRMLSVALDLPMPETREESRARGGRTGGRGRKKHTEEDA